MPKPEEKLKLQVEVKFDENVLTLLNRIDSKLTQVLINQGETMADLSALQAEVEQNTNAVDSASRLIDGLASQLEEALASDDPAAVQAVVDQLRANNQALADAVAANTQVNPQ